MKTQAMHVKFTFSCETIVSQVSSLQSLQKKSNVIIILEPLPPKLYMVLDLLLPSSDSQMSTLDCASKCWCLLIIMGAFFFCSYEVELVLI